MFVSSNPQKKEEYVFDYEIPPIPPFGEIESIPEIPSLKSTISIFDTPNEFFLSSSSIENDGTRIQRTVSLKKF